MSNKVMNRCRVKISISIQLSSNTNYPTRFSCDDCLIGAGVASVGILELLILPCDVALAKSFWLTEKNCSGSVDTDDDIDRPLSDAEPPPLSSKIAKIIRR